MFFHNLLMVLAYSGILMLSFFSATTTVAFFRYVNYLEIKSIQHAPLKVLTWIRDCALMAIGLAFAAGGLSYVLFGAAFPDQHYLATPFVMLNAIGLLTGWRNLHTGMRDPAYRVEPELAFTRG